MVIFFFSSRRRHTRLTCDWSSDVCSSDLATGRSGFTRGANGTGGTRSTMGMLWYLDKTGKLAVARVKTGLTDGQTTEIIPRDSASVTAGLQVITGSNAATSTSSSSSSSSNPLQPQTQRRGGPGGF